MTGVCACFCAWVATCAATESPPPLIGGLVSPWSFTGADSVASAALASSRPVAPLPPVRALPCPFALRPCGCAPRVSLRPPVRSLRSPSARGCGARPRARSGSALAPSRSVAALPSVRSLRSDLGASVGPFIEQRTALAAGRGREGRAAIAAASGSRSASV